MRWLLFILLFQTLGFSQRKVVISPADSTAYYIGLATFNKKINNYKSSLYFSQKAINYAQLKGNTQQKSDALYSLGTTYFELKKYEDAVEIFSKCAALLSSIPPSSQQAICYYNMGMCYMNLDEFAKAELNFNKSQAVYNILKIDASEPLKLQKRNFVQKQRQNRVSLKIIQ